MVTTFLTAVATVGAALPASAQQLYPPDVDPIEPQVPTGTVPDVGAGQTGADLATTGLDVTVGMVLVVALLLVGMALLLTARRLRAHAR